MTSARKRVLTFLAAISAFTAFVQWQGASTLVDSATGGLKWSGDIIRFSKENTQGLIQLIVLALYLEFVGLSKSRDRERKENEAALALLETTLASSKGSALISRGLAEKFGQDAAEHLMRNALKPCPILRGLALKIVVRHCKTGYLISLGLTYEKDSAEFLVAVTDNPLQCEALIATGLLSEVFVVSTSVSQIPAKARKRIRHQESDSYIYHDVEFRELNFRRKKKLFDSTSLAKDVEKFKIFEGVCPTMRAQHDGRVMFEIDHETTQSLDFPYTFWMSDRVLEIRSIEIDLSALDKRSQDGAKIHMFTSAIQWSEAIRPDNAIWHFPMQTWLLPGQGLMIVWPGKRH